MKFDEDVKSKILNHINNMAKNNPRKIMFKPKQFGAKKYEDTIMIMKWLENLEQVDEVEFGATNLLYIDVNYVDSSE